MKLKKLFSVVALVLMLCVLIAPVEAVNSGQANWAGDRVATALGTHRYVLNGERWVYQDSQIKVTRIKQTGVAETHTVIVVVRTKPDNILVGRWVDKVETHFAPDGVWEEYLYALALGVPNK